jgi:hypothetical protein
MSRTFSGAEKLEVIERLIEERRDANEFASRYREELSILKEIAKDIRSGSPERASEAIKKIEGALTVANAHKSVARGFKMGHLIGLGQLVIRYWPTLRLGLEQLEQSKEWTP